MAETLEDMQAQQIYELRERIRRLETALAPTNIEVRLEWCLTASEARVFAYLASRDQATKAQIMTALYADRIDEDPEIKIVDVFICKLRKKLAPFGVSITTLWGRGYSLDDRKHYQIDTTPLLEANHG